MEELQVIETTSGRQFKPWASREDVQAIEQAVEQAVQDPASVTAIASEIASGKAAIASAINAKGGSASATESFAELADDVVGINDSFVTYGVEVTDKIHWLNFICDSGAPARLPLTAIDDNIVAAISQPDVFRNCTALESVKMTALTTIGGGYTFQGCSALQNVTMPNLTTISGSGYVFNSCRALQSVNLPSLTTINSRDAFQACSALREINLPNITTIDGYGVFEGCSALREVNLPNLISSSSGYMLYNCQSLRSMILGTLTSISEPFGNAKTYLRNITIGQDTNINLGFHHWTATDVIAEGQSGINELNANLQTNLISKLYQGGGKILRLGAALYDITTQETRDMVTAKGWTLQRG